MKESFCYTLVAFLCIWVFFSSPHGMSLLIGRYYIQPPSPPNDSERFDAAQMPILESREVYLSGLSDGTNVNATPSLVQAMVQEQIEKIDRQIEELERMKRGYESRALQHQDAADRLQFQDQAYLETRRHLEIAEENREKAQQVQAMIDELQQQKQTLLHS